MKKTPTRYSGCACGSAPVTMPKPRIWHRKRGPAAWRGHHRFLGRARQSTWLHAIAINLWRKRLAQKQPVESLEEDRHGADPMQIEITKLTLDRALLALPATLREAFVLVKAEGLTHKEAAQALGIPQGTVQSRVFDATRQLRVLLSEEFPK
ncbi:MAG: RNA polymerase sigma factor [Armatimonas sp.]